MGTRYDIEIDVALVDDELERMNRTVLDLPLLAVPRHSVLLLLGARRRRRPDRGGVEKLPGPRSWTSP